MATLSNQERAVRDAQKEERAQDAIRARLEYDAQQEAIRAKTERLKALRLAKEAADKTAKAEKQRAKLAQAVRAKAAK